MVHGPRDLLASPAKLRSELSSGSLGPPGWSWEGEEVRRASGSSQYVLVPPGRKSILSKISPEIKDLNPFLNFVFYIVFLIPLLEEWGGGWRGWEVVRRKGFVHGVTQRAIRPLISSAWGVLAACAATPQKVWSMAGWSRLHLPEVLGMVTQSVTDERAKGSRMRRPNNLWLFHVIYGEDVQICRTIRPDVLEKSQNYPRSGRRLHDPSTIGPRIDLGFVHDSCTICPQIYLGSWRNLPAFLGQLCQNDTIDLRWKVRPIVPKSGDFHHFRFNDFV